MTINNKKKKSVFVAYLCWLFGGVFGLHLFYLERDVHAFLTWSTFGGYAIGWLADVTKIPRYVRDCNEDDEFIKDFVLKLQRNKKVGNQHFKFNTSMTFVFVCLAIVFNKSVYFSHNGRLPLGPVSNARHTGRRRFWY